MTSRTGKSSRYIVRAGCLAAAAALVMAALAEAWNGSSWTVQPTPNPDGYASLAAISCTSASACTAVGSKVLTAQSDVSFGADVPLAEQRN